MKQYCTRMKMYYESLTVLIIQCMDNFFLDFSFQIHIKLLRLKYINFDSVTVSEISLKDLKRYPSAKTNLMSSLTIYVISKYNLKTAHRN
jgi:hypothetical protein